MGARRLFGDDLVVRAEGCTALEAVSPTASALLALDERLDGQLSGATEGLSAIVEFVNGRRVAVALALLLPAHATERDTRELARTLSAVDVSMPIRPLAETTVPPHLDGHDGRYRASVESKTIAGDTDAEALASFLVEYNQSPATHRIYQRECERLLLWAIHERRKPLSSFDRDDFEQYLHFLADPQPADRWCGPKVARTKPQWRPFVGGLSESAAMTAMAAIGSFLAYLVDGRYLTGNPLGLIRQKRRKMAQGTRNLPSGASKGPRILSSSEGADKVERYLDDDMWRAVNEAVEAMPRKTDRDVAHYERLRFVCALLYLLAPRVSELESHTMSSFKESRGRWWWHVVGKGSKSATVPVNDDLLQALVRYRKHLGLSATPRSNEATPLLGSVDDPRKSITARRLNQILKGLFADAAQRLPSEVAYKADKLRMASAHWGRHTGLTAKADAGMEERYLQEDARHGDLRTTRRYIHRADDQRYEAAQKVRLAWREGSSKGE